MAHEIIMPALGMAQDTGLIVSWLKNEGDKVDVGDALMEVETDKATMEVEAEAAGFLTNVRAKAGEDVPVGDVIAYISESADEVVEGAPKEQAAAAPAPTETPTPKADPKPEPAAASPDEPPKSATATVPEKAAPSSANQGQILASPKAKKAAFDEGLDLSQLAAKGVPQPYHVKDLDMLRADRAAGVQPQMAGQTFHISARVPGKMVRAFKEWLDDNQQDEIADRAIWLGFASSAYREALGMNEDDVNILSNTSKGYAGYINADRQKLSEIEPASVEIAPSFVVRDLTGTSIQALQLSAPTCPVLSISKPKNAYLIALDFQADQLSDEQAIDFITSFTARLNEPLRHLL
ncbi:dihydrolipoyllysine-residue acetyltransferase [Maritalea myrionectae]|uniref:Dihydrolipoyllysine-residue acetyltransferase n=1 Tax=Maritalea myrionectae TaxID=454601 RepID=A0A2R4MBU7_9HYPH|nr:biotin/lipoyl-containing protein [Maritalea myrionectae]AVX03508.1 dihydrolipoyllysine-residue acetyltransferase [Maritalea myrionectae]